LGSISNLIARLYRFEMRNGEQLPIHKYLNSTESLDLNFIDLANSKNA
jgi:hypothetical protein